MEEVNNLINIPQNIRKFFRRTTYLKHDDPKLFEKIGNHLEPIRGEHDVDDNMELELL